MDNKEFIEVKMLYDTTNNIIDEIENRFKKEIAPYIAWFDKFLTDNGYEQTGVNPHRSWDCYDKRVDGHIVSIMIDKDVPLAYLRLGVAELLLDGNYMEKSDGSSRLYWHEAFNCAEYYLKNAKTLAKYEDYREVCEEVYKFAEIHS